MAPPAAKTTAGRLCAAAPSSVRGTEPAGQPVELFQTADRTQRRKGRRRAAPAGDDAGDRRIIDSLDAADDLRRVERRAMDEEMLRQLLAARRGALERHQQAGFHLRLGAG